MNECKECQEICDNVARTSDWLDVFSVRTCPSCCKQWRITGDESYDPESGDEQCRFYAEPA
jgi:hypothetical protein